MAKCRHSNCTIIEFYDLLYEHTWENGGYAGTSNDTWLTGDLLVRCDDCGLRRHYKAKRAPKWVKARLANISTEGQRG